MAGATEPLRLLAAGSLRAAMNDVAGAFAAAGGAPVEAGYGPSGLLRERIARGEAADVFASANLAHPQALAAAGKSAPAATFAHNRLCALVRADLAVSSATLLDCLLDPGVKLGTSHPKADPSGDYAWGLFERAERIRAGAGAALRAKARCLTGGPGSPSVPAGEDVYAHAVASGRADVFLTYCTNALRAVAQVPALQIIAIPQALEVEADYGMAVIATARVEALRFAAFVLSAPGQGILERHGFIPVAPTTQDAS